MFAAVPFLLNLRRCFPHTIPYREKLTVACRQNINLTKTLRPFNKLPKTLGMIFTWSKPCTSMIFTEKGMIQ